MLELCFNEGVGGLAGLLAEREAEDPLSGGRSLHRPDCRRAGQSGAPGSSWCGFSVPTPGVSCLPGSGLTKPGSAIAGPGNACAPSLREPRCGSGWTGPRAAGVGSWRQLKPWPSARPV